MNSFNLGISLITLGFIGYIVDQLRNISNNIHLLKSQPSDLPIVPFFGGNADSPPELFKELKGLIEATDKEHQGMWERWHKHLDWKQMLYDGWMLNHGPDPNDPYKRPQNVIFTFFRVNGHLIAVWDPCSKLVDYARIENWFDQYCPGVVRVDANNSHVILNHLPELNT